MKKIIFLIILTILIPYMIVTIFLKEKQENNFNFQSNMIVRVKREKANTIEEVSFEDYIMGVLAGEMPISFSEEALKAQAVAARSYVMKKMEMNKDNDYDIVDTVMNQVYKSKDELKESWQDKYDEYISKLESIINSTKGQYLSYNNQVIEAFFFSTSTGVTENSGEIFQTQLPYLVSVKSDWEEDISPVFNDEETLSLSDFYTKLNISYSETLKIEILKKTTTGRIKSISINDNVFTGNEITSKLSLRSTYFSIEQIESNVSIKTKGYGHGVGMSQYGAEGMARKGYTYEEILKYYYQGVEIKKL